MAEPRLKLTFDVLRIATLFVAEPNRPLWNYWIAKRLGLRAAITFNMLRRLEEHGWLVSAPERGYVSVDARRPARKHFRITEKGKRETMAALADLQLAPVSVTPVVPSMVIRSPLSSRFDLAAPST